jgi:serine/threonine protein kinase
MGSEDRLPPAPPGSGQDVVAGRYLVEGSLGSGGMGEVFVATDRVLDRRVALKRLSDTLVEDAPARARFFREARALARINHPNVVAVFDAGDNDGRPYLVMELIQGTTLRHELRSNGRFAPERAAAIGAGIAGGLAAAHAQGVVHRDVKPSNIFLTPTGEPKVGDFGIARIERGDLTLTLTGQAFGSPPYIAPEQAMGRTVDARADLYSLGCVLYHMVAGRRPFEGDDPVSLTYQHLHTVPTRLDAIDTGVSPELATLVAGLLQKDPADRPQTAQEVRRALGSMPSSRETVVVPTQPVVAGDATSVLPRRTQTLADRRKRPWWFFAAAAGVVILAVVALSAALTRGGADPARAQRSPSANPATSSASTSSVPATQAPPTTPKEAGAALVSLAQGMEASGAIDKHLSDEIGHTVNDVLEHLDDPADALDKLNELKDLIAEDVDHGKITSADAQSFNEAIDRFGATLPTSGSGSD